MSPFRHAAAAPASVFLSHFDGSDLSTTFVDEYAHTVTPVGQASLSTTLSKFGTASLRTADSAASFGGASAADKLSIASSADFAFGTGDFTVEFWINRTAGVGNNYVTFAGQNWNLYYDSSANELRFWDGGANRIISATTLSLGTWYHIALTRSGTSVRLFIDGVQTGSTYTNSGPTNLTAAAVLIGHYPASGSYHHGYMRDVRITKGVARYTAGFTPPAAQFPENGTDDPSYASVTALLHFFDKDGATTFTDVLGHTVTPSGSTMAITESAPACFFHYASIASHADFAFGTGDFTVEMQVYRRTAVSCNFITFAGQNWNVYYSQSSTALRFWDGSADRITGGATITPGTWYHIALTRSGTSVRLFFNGTIVGGAYTDSGPTNLTAAAVLLGHYPASADNLSGYIDEVRITKGLARYTANFTAPVAAFTS